MSDLIPPLRDLFFTQNGYDVAEDFAIQFLTVHHYNWRRAEDHWEVAVSKALNSKEIRPDAKPRKAMRRAVEVASAFLGTNLIRDRCPICRERGER
jgi:hypothetical protein